MEKKPFADLLLHTAFSCMACDGVIDTREIDLIKGLDKDHRYFSFENIEDKINILIAEINGKGKSFLSDYFEVLKNSTLTEEEKIMVIEVAVKTIEADEVIEYSEIRFLKIILSKLKVAKNVVMKKLPNINEDYLEQDILLSDDISSLKDDYFKNQTIPEFSQLIIDK